MLGWFILRRALTSDNCKHYYQVPYFFLRRFIATTSFVCVFSAFYTLPNVPEPSFFMMWYFSINSNLLINHKVICTYTSIITALSCIFKANYCWFLLLNIALSFILHVGSKWSSVCRLLPEQSTIFQLVPSQHRWLILKCQLVYLIAWLQLCVLSEHVLFCCSVVYL